jgi:excisionase family DNA binding protein
MTATISQTAQKLAYRIDEAVKASGLGRSFLYERMASGELPSVKIGGRRLILHQELVTFLSRNGVVAEEAPQVRPAESATKSNCAVKPGTAIPGPFPGQLELPWRK